MKRVFGFSLATGLILISAAAANATVLTFDSFTDFIGVIPGGYGGFDWSNFDYADGADYPPAGYHNGVVSPKYVAFNGFGQMASISRSSSFDFDGAYLTGAWNDGLNIDVKGYNGAALLYDATVVVDSLGPTFFNFNYLGVTELDFNSFGGVNHGYLPDSGGTNFVLDNFTYTVPEPSTFLLLGSGLSGLAILRRRRLLG